MPRRPAITSLLNGQAVKTRLGSTSVTCNLEAILRKARAQAAPPKPPPITTTRAADWAKDGQGKANEAAAAANPRTTIRENEAAACDKGRRLRLHAKVMF